MRQRIAQNALWNLVSLGSGAILTVAVPPFLTRGLSPEVFGAWSLVLQLASYVGLFGFGLQTVVARHVAIHDGAASALVRDKIVATAFWFLAFSAVVAMIGLASATTQIARIFPSLPQHLRFDVAISAILIGVALATTVPMMALTGVFVGIQRPAAPAIALTVTRLVLAAVIVVAAAQTGSLVVMANAYLVVVTLGSLVILLLWIKLVDSPTVSWALVNRDSAALIARECAGLTAWNLAMLLIVGLDLVIVARVDYPMVPYFAAASTLIAALNGAMQAISAAIMPVASRLTATGESQSLFNLICIATRLNGAVGLVTGAPLVLSGYLVLTAWVGERYGANAADILAILAVANCIRSMAMPYAYAVISAGLQSRVIVAPLVEGLTNLSCSIVLGLRYGAIGVAVGTLIGSCVGVAALAIQHPLRQLLLRADSGRLATLAFWPVVRVLLVLVLCRVTLPAAQRNLPSLLFVGVSAIVLVSWFGTLARIDRRTIVDEALRLFRVRIGGCT
jgi:O-antigen/teichoic acid export membrane protein